MSSFLLYYLFLRDAHNLFRSIIIMACLSACAAWSALFERSRWTKNQFAGLVFTSFLDVQVLLGLILAHLVQLPARHSPVSGRR